MRRLLPRAASGTRGGRLRLGHIRAPAARARRGRGRAETVTAARLRVRGGAPVELLAVHPRAPLTGGEHGRVARRTCARCRPPRRAAPCASSPETSTPRSTTPSCAACSTAATRTPPTRSATACARPGPRTAASRRRSRSTTCSPTSAAASATCGCSTCRGSDHRAVLAELELPRGVAPRAAAPRGPPRDAPAAAPPVPRGEWGRRRSHGGLVRRWVRPVRASRGGWSRFAGYRLVNRLHSAGWSRLCGAIAGSIDSTCARATRLSSPPSRR